MRLFPKSKINLGLNIVSKRSDGYHNLETVFFPLPIVDQLDVDVVDGDVNSPTIDLNIEGDAIDCRFDDNLIVKAFRLLSADYTLKSCKVTLKKHIPSQAGMGGGSSDAASMLHALNTLNCLNLSTVQLMSYASRLGADCPFFLKSQPVFATGIGNQFQNVEICNDLHGKWIAIVKPPVAVSTRDAYKSIIPQQPQTSCSEIVKRPISSWKHGLSNDFEDIVFKKFPLVAEIKQRFYDLGAVFSQMSGSGSAVYAIFENDPENITTDVFHDCFVEVKKVD